MYAVSKGKARERAERVCMRGSGRATCKRSEMCDGSGNAMSYGEAKA